MDGLRSEHTVLQNLFVKKNVKKTFKNTLKDTTLKDTTEEDTNLKDTICQITLKLINLPYQILELELESLLIQISLPIKTR